MRTRRFGASCAAALLLAACGSNDDEPALEALVPEVAGSPPTAVAVDGFMPAHGGTVVAAGDQHVEIVTREDGSVDAFVLTPEPPPAEQTQVTVRVPADDGRTHPMLLTWDPGEQRYRGRLRGARPIAGPVEVVMVVGAERYEGRSPRIVVIGAAPPAPEIRLVEAQAPRQEVVVVQEPAPQPTVVVHHPAPPTPVIVVQRPDPRPVVIVEQRSPRVRVHHDNGRHRGHGGGRGRVRIRAH